MKPILKIFKRTMPQPRPKKLIVQVPKMVNCPHCEKLIQNVEVDYTIVDEMILANSGRVYCISCGGRLPPLFSI
ncbi:MAG: hypothetical protein QXJ07_05515 [Candidatus Bathyarchaeia archaeon]